MVVLQFKVCVVLIQKRGDLYAMECVREIELDMEPGAALPAVRVKQGDASLRFIQATLKYNDDQYIPDADVTAMFREEKPDGTGVLLDSTVVDEELGRSLVTINADGTITVELVEQTTTCPGRCLCDICLIRGGAIISTVSFVLDVFRSPNTANLAESSSDFRTIVNAVNLLQNFIDMIDADDQAY